MNTVRNEEQAVHTVMNEEQDMQNCAYEEQAMHSAYTSGRKKRQLREILLLQPHIQAGNKDFSTGLKMLHEIK